jgi:hypothetical protein
MDVFYDDMGIWGYRHADADTHADGVAKVT